MNKSVIKEQCIKNWFMKRKLAAISEYKEVVENTPYYNYCVIYRGAMFNPLELKPKEIKDVYEVPEGSVFANKLNRYIRLMEDQQKVTSILTVILNAVETDDEFQYVVFGKESTSRKEELDKFKEEMQTDLSYLKRIRLLADMV